MEKNKKVLKSYEIQNLKLSENERKLKTKLVKELKMMNQKDIKYKNEIGFLKQKINSYEKNSDKKELNDLEEEEDEGDFNLDNLTEEEKMALIQQREILLKLQEEAEARGEHFDIQEYLAQLAEQSEEDDEIGNQEDKSDKFNKSF